jgi:putative RNA 2'-phosphotransferase
MSQHTSTSKFLSLVLRHNPARIGLTLSENGWVNTYTLIDQMNAHGFKIDMDILRTIVAEDSKQRYSFNEDETTIRANQGHSIQVDLELQPIRPPDVLYHGTASRFLESIQNEGLKKMGRQFVHLSADSATATGVGKRHGSPVVLEISAHTMFDAGISFYLSVNNVWLTDMVLPVYISIHRTGS